MLEKLVQAGRRLDPDVLQSVVVLGPLGIVGERLRASGVPVEALGMRMMPALLPAMRKLFTSVRATNDTVVVQTWLWHADLLGGLCARVAGNPLVVWNLRNSMPGNVSLKWTSTVVAKLCSLMSGRIPTAIVCNSVAAMKSHAAIGYRLDKCQIIPNGFDTRIVRRNETAGRAFRSSWGIADDQLLIGLVARVDPLKDHLNFIRAASLLAGRYPAARFVLVGDGTTTDVAIATELRARGLNDRFRLVERQSDVPGVMSALDVFCLSSISEGFPNVLGEAMLCGTPCVATDVGDTQVILGDDRWVAPPASPEHLAECVSQLLDMPAPRRREVGERQRTRMEHEFCIDAIWHRYLELYRRLAAGIPRT
jgi:glycosyltransferase involved in cell wall biosynthesis